MWTERKEKGEVSPCKASAAFCQAYGIITPPPRPWFVNKGKAFQGEGFVLT
jgi:hypothetical protein